MAVENGKNFREYLLKLGKASGSPIASVNDYLEAIRQRHDYFQSRGCKLADHGIDTFYSAPSTEEEITAIYNKVAHEAKELSPEEVLKFKSRMLYENAVMVRKGWVRQFHYGAMEQ